MSALSGIILLPVLLQYKALTVCVGCVAANKNPRLSSTIFAAVLREQECGFVRFLKPTVSSLSRRAAVPSLLLGILNTALLHRWMSAGDGSSAGVCASPEAQRVQHVSRWAAVHLLLLCFFLIRGIIAAPVENILLYTAYTPARRYCLYCCTGCTRQRIFCCTLGKTLA